ncbi:MAG: hypothetical protein Tsb0017_14860 [Geothermobacteraceae bacterium]
MTISGEKNIADLQSRVHELENQLNSLKKSHEDAIGYIRDKINQLLHVMGTLPLKPEELDDKTLIQLDPIGIIAESFAQILRHHRKTNEELALARDELAAILDSTGAGILVVDRERRLQAFNPRARDLLCHAGTCWEGDPIGQDFHAVICPPQETLETCIFTKVLATRQVAEQIDSFRKNNYLQVIGSPILTETGDVKLVVLAYIDVTERLQTEEALRESENRHKLLSAQLKAVFDGIKDPLFLIDKDKTIILKNEAADEMMSGSPQPEGISICDAMLPGDDPCQESGIIDECFRTKSPQGMRWISPQDRSIDVQIFPVESGFGTVSHAVVAMKDVTDQVLLQEETLRASQLAALGELAAGVAHEINNPINGIINYAQILVNISAADSRTAEVADRILHEGDRIADIVTHLLNFARPDKNKRVPVPIKELFDNALALIGTMLTKDSIRYHVDIEPNLPPVLCNPQKTEQVLLNLLTNARYALNEKYVGPADNKKITMSAKRTDGGTLCIQVRDEGTGISELNLARIFTPFFSTKPAGKGTGLGLSISKRIIEELDGTLKIDSKQGDYTCVTIELPAYRAGQR